MAWGPSVSLLWSVLVITLLLMLVPLWGLLIPLGGVIAISGVLIIYVVVSPISIMGTVVPVPVPLVVSVLLISLGRSASPLLLGLRIVPVVVGPIALITIVGRSIILSWTLVSVVLIIWRVLVLIRGSIGILRCLRVT